MEPTSPFKLTLLFAENGQGKTTLCAILRSLQSGRYEFISERKTLGAGDPCSAQIRLDGNTISFSNDSWSAKYPNIAIFDSVFVHDNVYAGDYVEHDHKKNLYRVIVGAQGVQLAQKVDALDGQIRAVGLESLRECNRPFLNRDTRKRAECRISVGSFSSDSDSGTFGGSPLSQKLPFVRLWWLGY